MKRIIILSIALTIGIAVQAQTFIVDGIGYSIISDSTCGVYSCSNTICNIPPTVVYDSVEYTVNAIYGTDYMSRIYSSSIHISYGNGMYAYSNNQYGAMYGNNIIQSITIPYTIEKIEFYALNNFSSLTEVHWNAKNASIDHIQNTAYGMFSGCNNLSIVVFEDSVQRIPDNFLRDCQTITNIVIPNNVTEIGQIAFYNCSGISNITLSNNLRYIGADAFAGCTGLFSLTLPDSVHVIENNAFRNCINLYDLTIGSSVETIGSKAFENCTSLHNVTYNPHNASYLSTYYMFNGSNSIANLTIGSEVERIPPYFMNAKPNIHNVILPEGLTHIGSNAFYNCGLEELVIPSTVTNIGQNAFYNNTNISRIVSLPTTPPAIYQSTFGGISNSVETIVPCGTSAEYNIRPWWNGMTNVKETCRYYTTQDTICEGGTYEYGTHSASVSGTYYDTIHIDQYVDSMITIQLVVNPSYDYTFTEQICNGQSYTANGFNENETELYTQTLQSIYGCDSVVRLNLTVNPTYDITFEANICQGDSYTQYGFNTLLPGNHSQSLSTIAGCDSIVHLQLTVNPTYSEHLSATITDAQNYQLVDCTLNQPGVYQKLLLTQVGCDSLLTLTLTVIPSVDTLIVHDTVLYPDTIIVVDTLVIHDTIHVTDTIVPCPIYRTYIHASIKIGETYFGYGFNVSSAGVYCDTLQTVDGCDSIVCLYLIENVGIEDLNSPQIISIYPNPATSTITVSIPEGNHNLPINIIDNNGKIVKKVMASNSKEEIDVSTLSTGVYYVRIGKSISKLVIK